MTDALLDGLTDYTSDERGDVGSWVRIACVKGLASFIRTLFMQAATLPSLSDYLPPLSFHNAIGGILKQGVERLDNVRQQAGESFVDLLSLPLPDTGDPGRWQIQGATKMRELFIGYVRVRARVCALTCGRDSEKESVGWNDGSWLFPRAVQLLDIERYREQLLAGIILSTSTKTDSTVRCLNVSIPSYLTISL